LLFNSANRRLGVSGQAIIAAECRNDREEGDRSVLHGRSPDPTWSIVKADHE
jgi:hypothetical protein